MLSFDANLSLGARDRLLTSGTYLWFHPECFQMHADMLNSHLLATQLVC